MLLTAAREGMAMSLPIAITMITFGDTILRLWMGPEYANWPAVIIMFSGFAFVIGSTGIINVVKGLNAHGKLAIRYFVVRIGVFIVAASVVYSMGWTAKSAAAVAASSLASGPLFILPYFLKRRFKISLRKLLRFWFVTPFLCATPLFAAMLLTRYLMAEQLFIAALLAYALTGVLYLVICWFVVLSESVKQRLKTLVINRFNRRVIS
jgi:hypothetical protein